MKSYSGLTLAAHALTAHRRWPRSWRNAEPAGHYDVVIVGGGGHGLSTAYYLAKTHGIRRVAVLEKGYLGSGNSGRNTQVCRSNYFYPESAAFYDHSLKLYERLDRQLNFNIMFSPRGNLELSHSDGELEMNLRWANAMKLNGVDSEMMSREEIRRLEPLINLDCRFPVRGGFIQRRAGIARHDAVIWAYARAASAAGVTIVQSCEVLGFNRDGGRVKSVLTNRGEIHAGQFALCVAGHSSQLAALAGLRLPIESIALQAMVSEPVKPVLNTVVGSAAVHAYISQSDRGEIVIGGGADRYNSYAQRGALPTMQETITAAVELFPAFSRLRMMRQWAGICDISPDASPIVGRTGLENLYISAGWGTGGYKAIPAGGDTLAYTMASGQTHALLRCFQLSRFTEGRLVDEAAAAGVAH